MNQVPPYTLVKSHRRHRSAALQVTPSGEVIVQAPWYMPRFVIDKFVSGHTHWIVKRQAEVNKPTAPRTRHFATDGDLIDFINQKCIHYQHAMDLIASSIVYKHVKTYWGSCSPSGKLSFNLELAYAPPEAVEYVVVHELAHLKYRGHGVKFWDLVTTYYPNANSMRRVLKQINRRTD